PKLIEKIFATEAFQEKYPDLISRAEQSRVTLTLVSDSALKSLSDTTTPQGVVAVCQQFHVSLEDVLASKPKLIAFLAQIRDPGNAGTVLRAADAAGADAVVFSKGSVDIYNPKVVRSTTGSMFHLPFVVEADIEIAIDSLKQDGLQVLAADINGSSLAGIDESTLIKPSVWLFGNEAWGLEPEVASLADTLVQVPIYGAAESLNLATAASVCLYASAFAQNG
ncbi:MAG: RNA methyltransferase, partial [Actinobacteria bacterium]|nr:RNA methyltransferase [Actinomycetota bacterium]